MESCADGSLMGVPDKTYTMPLAGVEFTVYADAGLSTEVGRAQSDREGLVSFTGLPTAATDTSYYIKETILTAIFR